MDNTLLNFIPEMLTGEVLDDALRIAPDYNDSIRKAPAANRLVALQDLYRVYIPTEMSREVYTKLYLALLRSLQKKQSIAAIRQFSENQNRIKSKEYTSIIGGSDNFTVIGDSGIGKSATVSCVVNLISPKRVVDLPNGMRIIPCVQVQTPADCSVKGLLFEILRKVDEALDTRYHYNATRINATADILIGSVSTVALNHIGLLIVDEIQNMVNSKNGAVVVGMLTQLINNAGISICMVGTPKSAQFFGQEMMLARRSLGLSYSAFEFGAAFERFCSELLRYQYVRNRTEASPDLIQWLYHYSGGNSSVVVSLLHDAQEIAILDGSEKLDISSLAKAYNTRLGMLHDYLYREPVRAKKPEGKHSRGSFPAPSVPVGSKAAGERKTASVCPDKDNLIEEVVADAKQLRNDVVEELVNSGICIVEVLT